jgi:hypothetical protein
MKKRRGGTAEAIPPSPIFKIIEGGPMDYLKKAQDGFAACQKTFDVLESEKKTLLEQQRAIGQRLNELGAEQIRLDGEAKGYKTLIDAKETDGPAPSPEKGELA